MFLHRYNSDENAVCNSKRISTLNWLEIWWAFIHKQSASMPRMMWSQTVVSNSGGHFNTSGEDPYLGSMEIHWHTNKKESILYTESWSICFYKWTFRGPDFRNALQYQELYPKIKYRWLAVSFVLWNISVYTLKVVYFLNIFINFTGRDFWLLGLQQA